LTSVIASGGNTSIQGKLNSNPNKQFASSSSRTLRVMPPALARVRLHRQRFGKHRRERRRSQQRQPAAHAHGPIHHRDGHQPY
jgi:hypothetical protein